MTIPIRISSGKTIQVPDGIEAQNLKLLAERRRGERFYVILANSHDNIQFKLAPIRTLAQKIYFARNKESQLNYLSMAVDESLFFLEKQPDARRLGRSLLRPGRAIDRLSSRIYDRKYWLKTTKEVGKSFMASTTARLRLGKSAWVDLNGAIRLPNEAPSHADKRLSSLPVGYHINLEGPEGDTHSKNLKKLITRAKGTRFKVVNGRLKKTSGCISKKGLEKVKEVVTRTLQALNEALEKNREGNWQELVRYLFRERGPLASMSTRVFSRAAIEKDSCLEEALDPNLQRVRKTKEENKEKFKEAKAKGTLDAKTRSAYEKALLEEALVEYKFAQSLGISLERVAQGGSGGARYAKDRANRRILVIKPDDEGPHGLNNPQWYAKIKRLFVSPRPCLHGNSEGLAEQASYRADRSLGINMVPVTGYKRIVSPTFVGPKAKWCSVQLYVDKCITLQKYLGTSSGPHAFSRQFQRRVWNKASINQKIPPTLMEKMAIANWLAEDTDAHFNNILVHKLRPDSNTSPFQREVLALFDSEQTESGETIRFIKIDGGPSHPHKHPTTRLEMRNQYLFEVLPFFGDNRKFDADLAGTIQAREANFVAAAYVYAKRLLLAYLVELKGHKGKEIFKTLMRDNRGEVRNWLLRKKGVESQDILRLLPQKFAKKHTEKLLPNLERIRGSFQTRLDSWKMFRKAAEEELSIRDLLSKTQHESNIKKYLEGYEPDIDLNKCR